MDIEDPEQLLNYLHQHQGVVREEVTDIKVLGGGVSNRTVLVHKASGKDWVMKQALEKLRVPDDWFSDPQRIHREAEAMRILKPLMPEASIVDLVFEDSDHHIIAMDAVDEPHSNWKTHLLQGHVDLDIIEQFGRCLASIHGKFDFVQYPEQGILWDTHFFESLRIEPYYLRTAEKVPEISAFIHELVDQTRMRIITLVHGDYSPKNILVHQGRMVLLDHEVIHIGDPAFDVGFSLTHLLSKANHLTPYRTALFDAALLYWETYKLALDHIEWLDTLEPTAVSHTLGCMLARIEGRSPLEYLGPEAKRRQKEWCIQAIHHSPTTVPDLITSYREYLNQCL